ncbi:MAG: YggS family pyridoxal phosphate-dependent enzyme [Alphaproteobacteria bacterium]
MQDTIESEVAANLADVRDRIGRAARDGGRDPAATTLIAVSKQQPEERIDAALAAGQRVFGENRVQEAEARWAERRKAYPDLELHLIGPLQTNKARLAVQLFDVIQTVDRPRLAATLARVMQEEGRRLPCYVEVNTGKEEQKAGVKPADAAAFVKECRETHGLDVVGLMCIPPAEDAPGPHFAFLKDLAAKLGLPNVSMGMSADFEAAVGLGATHVRVGSAIFGARQPRTG